MTDISVDLVSAEKKVWSGLAELVSAPSIDGQLGIMSDHLPILAVLVPGQVRVSMSDGSTFAAEVSATAGNEQAGFLSFDDNLLTVVADEITPVLT